MLVPAKSVSWLSETGFSDQAWEDYQHWINTNDKIRDRVNELIKQCKRTPFNRLLKKSALDAVMRT